MTNSRYEESSSRASINKNYCPKCNEKLKAVTIGNIVNARSNSMQKDVFTSDGTYLYGKMKTYRTEFQCPLCRLSYTMEDLRKIEKNNKRM